MIGPGEKSSEGQYETFDSGEGPTVPDGTEGDFAHQDSEEGLNGYTLNEIDTESGSVPEVPSRKR